MSLASLIARTYYVLPLLCTVCGREMRLIAFISESVQIRTLIGPVSKTGSLEARREAR